MTMLWCAGQERRFGAHYTRSVKILLNTCVNNFIVVVMLLIERMSSALIIIRVQPLLHAIRANRWDPHLSSIRINQRLNKIDFYISDSIKYHVLNCDIPHLFHVDIDLALNELLTSKQEMP